MLSFSFVGFSQIEDVNTFIEVLHRVAPSKTAMKSRLEDNLEFLDSAYNKFVKQENLNESELTLSEDMTVIATTSSDVSFRPGSTGNPKMDPKQISPSTDSGIGGLSILRGSFKNPNIG